MTEGGVTKAAAGKHPFRSLGSLGGRLFSRVWLFLLLVALWEVWARNSEESYFPPPSTILPTMRDVWFSGPASHLFLNGKAIDDFTPSLSHIFFGWILASVVGIVLGLALGRSRTAFEYLDPLFQLGRATPPPTLIPFFIIVFHFGGAMHISAIVFGVIWPVLLNTVDGARTVDAVQLDTAKVFGITGSQRLFRLILPAAAPKIFAGLRVSLSLAVILMVVSELVGSTTGIGSHLLTTQRTFEIPKMWAGIVLLGILGYAFNEVLLLIERRLLAWHTGVRRLADA
jgi:ABC-type nitrate/sulfonate/bicarbonate transport system permease component